MGHHHDVEGHQINIGSSEKAFLNALLVAAKFF